MCTFIIACLISLSALSLSSCTQKKVATSVAYMDFPQTIELKARVQPLDTALFRYPFRVRVQGDKAVVMDLHGTDYFCHVFHYPGFRYFASFGKRGEAPEEMLSAENIRWHGQSLWGLDAGKSVLTKYDFTSSGCSIVPQKVINMDADMLRVLDFVMVDDFTFIVPDGSGSSRFCWVNYQGKLLRRTGQIPSANAEALQNARPALAQAWRSFIDYNPRNGVLAAVTQLGEVLEVFNLKIVRMWYALVRTVNRSLRFLRVMVFLRVSWDLAMSKWQTVLSMRFFMGALLRKLRKMYSKVSICRMEDGISMFLV